MIKSHFKQPPEHNSYSRRGLIWYWPCFKDYVATRLDGLLGPVDRNTALSVKTALMIKHDPLKSSTHKLPLVGRGRIAHWIVYLLLALHWYFEKF